MAAGPIPWSKMLDYWQHNKGFPLEQFMRVMREMDGAYRESARREQGK